MRLWSFISDRQRFMERREANLLDEHAHALTAGDMQRAQQLRDEQAPGLAALMDLAAELALVLRPLPITEETRARIRRRMEWAHPETRTERLASVVRGHGREAVLGAAIVGTAALSLGRVALYYHRKRQEE
ncbi:MAG: hypothetical protein HPY83_08330 [Anaerolineae bacterium]|nr:hypothetical protein [Anaerolineae bacterium]